MLFGEFVALPSEKDRQVEEAGKAERTLRVTSARGTFPFAVLTRLREKISLHLVIL